MTHFISSATQQRRRTLRLAAASLLAASLPGSLSAQTPSIDTVRVVTGLPPGGTSDTICRRVAERPRGSCAKNAVVENRAGARGDRRTGTEGA